MKKKFEPLKGKKRTMIGAKPLREFDFFFVDDVESAVRGLLEEIEIDTKDTEYAMKSEFDEGIIEGLRLAKLRIKKWFADVVENDDDKELREDFIKEVQKAENRVKEGKFKEYTIDEFKKKFKPD